MALEDRGNSTAARDHSLLSEEHLLNQDNLNAKKSVPMEDGDSPQTRPARLELKRGNVSSLCSGDTTGKAAGIIHEKVLTLA